MSSALLDGTTINELTDPRTNREDSWGVYCRFKSSEFVLCMATIDNPVGQAKAKEIAKRYSELTGGEYRALQGWPRPDDPIIPFKPNY